MSGRKPGFKHSEETKRKIGLVFECFPELVDPRK
jgi:hypothetical protein